MLGDDLPLGDGELEHPAGARLARAGVLDPDRPARGSEQQRLRSPGDRRRLRAPRGEVDEDQLGGSSRDVAPREKDDGLPVAERYGVGSCSGELDPADRPLRGVDDRELAGVRRLALPRLRAREEEPGSLPVGGAEEETAAPAELRACDLRQLSALEKGGGAGAARYEDVTLLLAVPPGEDEKAFATGQHDTGVGRKRERSRGPGGEGVAVH